MPNTPLPRSPRSPSGRVLEDPLAVPAAKPRRTVRLPPRLPHDESSSDEEIGPGVVDGRPAGDVVPGNPRHSSYPGASHDTSPPSRITSLTGSSTQPKISRSISSAAGPSRIHGSPFGSMSAKPPSSSIAPPPANIDQSFQDWRNKYSSHRTSSSRSTTSIASTGKLRDDSGILSTLRSKIGGGLLESGWTAAAPHTDGETESEDEDDDLSPPTAGVPRTIAAITGDQPGTLIPPPSLPRTPSNSAEERERVEWHSMLASILAGDVLRGESSRIGEERGGDEEFRVELGRQLWWELRARLRNRTEVEEKKRVEERRERVVDSVLEEVERFVVKRSPGPAGVGRRLSAEDSKQAEAEAKEQEILDNEAEDGEEPKTEDQRHESEISALDQVSYILQKLSLVEGLYPTTQAFRQTKTLYNSQEFQARVDALTSWSTVVYLLQVQLAALQKWTGSDDLDITKPNTTKEKALVGKNRYHPLDAKAKAHAQSINDQAADDSTFLERIMKEDNLERTFGKRVFGDLRTLILNAKETVISHLPLFDDLKLPDFQFELVRLIGFPCRLVIEALKVRLDAASKLVDPSDMVVNDMMANFRLTIMLAVVLKGQYEEMMEPDADGRWMIPSCLPPEYDSVVLNGLRMFFRLLHWKLKSGSNAIYFRETEVIEADADFLYEAAEAVPGGDLVVAERFCSLTHKLMTRACKYFEDQIRKPMKGQDVSDKPEAINKPVAMLRQSQREQNGGGSKPQGQMNTEEMLVWYGKILDAVRMRYRKLQRFARKLTQRFDNSSEYFVDDSQVDQLVDQLYKSGHFLVYNERYVQEGTYILAPEALWNDPSAIQQVLQRVFAATDVSVRQARRASDPLVDDNIVDGQIVEGGSENPNDEDDPVSYLILFSPTCRFEWTGGIMAVDIDFVDLDLEDNRLRLISDGLTTPLSQSRRYFHDSLIDVETGEPGVQLTCLHEAQAHLPRIRHQINRIAASNYKLTERFIQSASIVSDNLKGMPGTQDMTQSWYQFASEHGKRAINHMDPDDVYKFKKLLMRLAISWCSFICNSCDPADRKTFRWTVTALRTTWWVTEDTNILYLDGNEFQLLKRYVASLVALMIFHFDILGARSTMQAKKEADRMDALRRLQRQQENIDDDFIPRTPSPSGQNRYPMDRSIRLVQEERLRLIELLENQRAGFSNDQHLIGQVLDEQVSEDRALVFLAASSSNIALRWQQGAFIGGGANGNVYIGFNLDSGGIMAVKEIRVQDLSNSPALYKQIKDESDVMSMLSHRNIVEYFGIEVHRDRVFIFQEYCEGGSLANQLEHGRIEEEEVVSFYGFQMLCGLQYLHSKGIEHRDVKPENILLGSGSTIKFVDFGAAKVIAKGNRTMAKTRVIRTKGADGPAVMNSLAGTPMYMAPEVIRANEKTGHLGAADIWSMGCVLLEISTGRKPWSNLDNEWAIMFHIGIATQAPPLPDHGELSELGIDFIERCLELDPSLRPTATDLLGHEWIIPMAMTFHEHEDQMAAQHAHSGASTLVDQQDPNAYTTYTDHSKGGDQLTPTEEGSSFENSPYGSADPSIETSG